MYCKNCDTPLRYKADFCHGCGAKIIRHRLTIKNLWADFSERFLNLENYLLKTFIAMFKQPEAVITGYISGVRKRYISPAGYFTFALTLIGFLFFIQQKFFWSTFTEAFSSFDSQTKSPNPQVTESVNTVLQGILEYQSLILILTIPLLAIMSKIVFYNYKNFNFSEHIVLNIYTYSHYTIVISFLQLLTLWSSYLFLGIAFLTSLFQFIYYTYVLKRIFQLDLIQTIVKILIFIIVSSVFYFIIIVLVVASLFIFSNFFEEIVNGLKKTEEIGQVFNSVQYLASLKYF